jgi:hypothetical protein
VGRILYFAACYAGGIGEMIAGKSVCDMKLDVLGYWGVTEQKPVWTVTTKSRTIAC